MIRVLVTGGAGFIGSHLCRVLLERGHAVIAADSLFSGRKRNILPLMSNPRFEFMRHDIIQPLFIECDQIYNLACPASPVHYQYNPIRTVKVNVLGTMNVLGLAKRCGARMLQASTSEVYGDPQVHPQPESYWGHVNPIGPRACYDEGKRIAETLCRDYHVGNGVDVCIARIFNTYGPHMALNDGRVVSNFLLQALRGEPITIYGDGSQTRSFCFVSDLVEGLIRLMECGERFEPVNLGNPEERTIREIAERIVSLTGSSSKLVEEPLPQDDPVRRKPDIRLAKQLLNWQPSVSLDDGLKETVADFQARVHGHEEW